MPLKILMETTSTKLNGMENKMLRSSLDLKSCHLYYKYLWTDLITICIWTEWWKIIKDLSLEMFWAWNRWSPRKIWDQVRLHALSYQLMLKLLTSTICIQYWFIEELLTLVIIMLLSDHISMIGGSNSMITMSRR